MPVVERSTHAADRIEAAIRSAVGAGRLLPGSKLGEGELAQIFDTSRTMVRQALQRLSYLGIVRLESNRGAFIASATRKEAEDLYAARRVIEAAAIAALARDCTANDIRVLRRHIELENEARASDDWQHLVQIRADFHLKIAELSGNAVFVEMLERILARTAIISTFYLKPRGHSCEADHHQRLIEALVENNVEEAVRLMEEHLTVDERSLVIPDRPSGGKVDLSFLLDDQRD